MFLGLDFFPKIYKLHFLAQTVSSLFPVYPHGPALVVPRPPHGAGGSWWTAFNLWSSNFQPLKLKSQPLVEIIGSNDSHPSSSQYHLKNQQKYHENPKYKWNTTHWFQKKKSNWFQFLKTSELCFICTFFLENLLPGSQFDSNFPGSRPPSSSKQLAPMTGRLLPQFDVWKMENSWPKEILSEGLYRILYN